MPFGSLSAEGDLGSLPPVGRARNTRPLPGSPAGSGRRCAATVIDLAIAVLVILVPLVGLDRALGPLGFTDEDARTVWRASAAVWLAAFVLLYSPLSVALRGATPGKRVMGLEVVRRADGERLGYGPAVVRHLANLVVTGVPVLCVANASSITLSADALGIHDKAVGSAVVHRR
ncbi:RDD family protein [Streptomyces sp. NBC_00091]|uniref:RDD family protein n=1 Tax=Streptomyces sp. NBC_00091 TaxID=2975648 RepID=UPI0022509E01|nr:RDD family protein [Streptomyces sp. NBC_00091]MCX5375665.1 RDD family protein [Streptomyces sp. NBC_00091]